MKKRATSAAFTEAMIDEAISSFDRVFAQIDGARP